MESSLDNKSRYEEEKRQFKVYFFIIALVAAFAAGVFLGRSSNESGAARIFSGTERGEDLSASDLGVLWDAWDVIGQKYAGEIPTKEKVVEGAARGMIASLDDPYTVFWNKEESEDFASEMEGSFEGIGAEIGIRNQILTVIAPMDGTPAANAGIKSGDKIFKINDEVTTEMTLDEAISRIRGPKGTQVRLTIIRGGAESSEPLEFELTRDTIDVKSVSWEMKDDQTAYLRLGAFMKDTESEFNRAADEILKSGAKRIVLDLRNNPGGYLETSVYVAGYFLPRATLVVTEDFGEVNSFKNNKYTTSGSSLLAKYPLVVLVNEGTASAAEILAGALRDNREIKLIGEKTFGKGSVQEIEKLAGGSTIKVTVARWLTPKGANINKEGLTPDIKQEAGDDENNDQQLQKALETVKTIQ